MSNTQAFDELWAKALDKYIETTSRTESEQALLKQLKTPDDLEKQLETDRDKFSSFRAKQGKLTGRLKKVVKPFTVLSGIASSAISLSPFAPASTIFGAVVFVVKAADGVSEAYDWIDQLFDKLGDFTVRLDEYCTEDIGPHLGTKVVQILECLLEILARSEKTIKVGRWKKYAAVLFLGKDEEIKASFDKLAKLFDDEQRLVSAIIFATNQRMDKRIEGIEKIGKKTLEGVNVIQQGQQDQARDKILDWIFSTTKFPDQWSDIIARREEGTGLWFLDTPEFDKWINESRQTLFCPGMPGAGKTMMAAITIEHVLRTKQNDSNAVTYIFCNYKTQADHNTTTLLAAILRQLVQTRRTIPEPVSRLYKQHSNRGTKPSLEEIFGTLQSVLRSFSRVYMVVDALDECLGKTRKWLLERILALQKDSSINLCLMATSRFVPEIEKGFKGKPKLDIRASDGDVKRFVAGQIDLLPEFVQSDGKLRILVQDTITQAVAGMLVYRVSFYNITSS
jgi:hypothetical protein